MSKRKPDFSMNCKIWFPNYTAEISGGIEGCVAEAFGGLPADRRTALLERLAKIDANVSAREAAEDKKPHLRYDVLGAVNASEMGRPADVIKRLGIKYGKWVPQTIGDQIWLLGVTVPEGVDLPEYITPLSLTTEQELYWFTDGKKGQP